MGEIKGPLGMWRFPLFAFILSLFERGEGSKSGGLSPVARNEEKWSWTDYKGRKRELVIHREVKR